MTEESFPQFEEEARDELDEIFDDFEESIPEDATYITVRTSNGATKYVPTSEAMKVADVMQEAALYIGGRVEYFLDGATVNTETVIPVGATLTVIGSVKGG